MWVELGHFALILAMLLAAAQAVFGIAGGARSKLRWMAAAESAVLGQFVFVAIAVGTLVHAFVTNDFSVKYVTANSNSALPTFYRVAALWGAHEGSLILWITVLSLWTLAVLMRSRHLPRDFLARVLGVLGIVSFGFMLFTLSTSNPFERLIPAWVDGRDLNPLLQDFALAVHPPILYTGYVGFSVSFAFACAAMLEGRRDNDWARWMRPWTIMSWAFLSCGIALGSWWAYYELGWGGYWFWDPVENASFMPWLLGTALIHSLAVTDKRGLFKSWTLLLAIGAFSLSLLGTFLVRSGVLVSVHSFAADPKRGLFVLAFLILMIGGALVLFAWRAPRLASNVGFAMISREAFLLFNNMLLVVACAVVLGGTLAPLVAQVFDTTLSVGKPYFDLMFKVPMIPALILLGIGIHAHWKRGGLAEARTRLLLTGLIASLLAAGLLVGLYGSSRLLAMLGAALALWIALSSLYDPVMQWRRGRALSAAVTGMTLAHLGLACAVFGVSLVETQTIERDVALSVGQSATLGDYTFTYEGGKDIRGPNYNGVRGAVTVTHSGRVIAALSPEKRQYWVQGSTQTEAGIVPGWNRDLFAALGEDVGGGGWSLRLQYRPFIRFIWLGALLMALGGVTTLFDRRYRVAVREAAADSGRAAAPVDGTGRA